MGEAAADAAEEAPSIAAGRLARVGGWLEERLVLGRVRRRLADAWNRPGPSGLGWGQTLGVVALVLLICQLASGALLLLYYRPTADGAHASVVAIMERVPAGWFVRGMHVWGAHVSVALVLIHAIHTFWVGGYKRPREALWIVGLLLAATVLALAFTGALLPWSQHGFWGATIATEMAGAAPVGGESLRRLVRGAETVSEPTLGRFFTLHAVVLPAILAVLVAFHLRLVRRLGLAPSAAAADAATAGAATAGAEPTAPGAPVLPDHALRCVAAAVVAVGGLILLVLARPAVVPEQATPLETPAGVRPEWYFLPLYQIQKYFSPEGWFGIAGSTRDFLVTNLLLALPLLVPFVDRGPERRPARRRLVLAGGLLWLAGAATLAIAGTLAERDVEVLGVRCVFDDLGRPGFPGRAAEAEAAAAAAAAASDDDGDGDDDEPWRSYEKPDEKCVRCHIGEWRAFTRSVHFRDDYISCTACHGGDGETEDQALAHHEDDDFVEHPLEACVMCHEAEGEKLEDGPHGEAIADGCIACHADHETAPATHALLTESCANCHRDDAAILETAARLRAAIESLEVAIPHGGERLIAARDATGTLLAEELATIRRLGERDRPALRVDQHEMDVEALIAAAGEAEATAAGLADEATARLEAARRRPRWGALVVVIVIVNLTLLALLRAVLRDAREQLGAPPARRAPASKDGAGPPAAADPTL